MARTILIVDDDRSLRRLLSAQFAGAGHDVLEAGTAREGRALLTQRTVDLAIIDGLLPDTRGVHWIEELRREHRALPIVFISAYWRDLGTYRKLTDELGVALVLYKPFEPERLRERVEALLKALPAHESLPFIEIHDEDDAVELPHLELDIPDHDAVAEAGLDLGALPDMSDLVREYGESLPRRLAELRDLLFAAPEGGGALGEAITRAHRLRGTAGSYGFAAVSAAAGEIEDLLIEVQGEHAALTRNWPRIERALSNAQRVIGSVSLRPSAPETPLGSELVLVVDADPDFALSVSRFVREQMMQVAVASSAAEALDKVRSAELVAAVVDLATAARDGIELVPALRALRKDLPIALVSSDDSLASRLAALRAGATLFLTKPIPVRDFAGAMRQLLSGASAVPDRVLVLSRDETLASGIEAALRAEGTDPRVLALPEQLFASLAEQRPDLLLLDERALDVSLHELAAALALSPSLRDMPVMALSDASDTARAGGRALVLSRDTDAATLVAHARVRLLESRLAQQRLGIDGLTGLPSRRAFLDALDVRLSEAQRTGSPLAVAMLDIDRMGAINERYGRAVGDSVLSAVAHVMSERMRNEDLRCRWAGDAFVLLLPGQNLDGAARAVERLFAELARLRVSVPGGEALTPSCSVGLAAYPDDGLGAAALVFAAETRLAEKRDGSGAA